MSGWYREEMSMLGKWTPVRSADKPNVKDGRLVRAGSIVPRVRRVTEIPKFADSCSLDELQAAYEDKPEEDDPNE